MLTQELQTTFGKQAPGPFFLQVVGNASLTGTVVLETGIPATLLTPIANATLTGQVVLDVGTPAVLPCPDTGVRRLLIKGVDQTEGGGAPLWQEPQDRIDRDLLELPFSVLTDAERDAMVAVYAGGDGMVIPFELTIFGATDLFVFDEPLTRTRSSAGPTTQATVRLRKVTPAGWTP